MGIVRGLAISVGAVGLSFGYLAFAGGLTELPTFASNVLAFWTDFSSNLSVNLKNRFSLDWHPYAVHQLLQTASLALLMFNAADRDVTDEGAGFIGAIIVAVMTALVLVGSSAINFVRTPESWELRNETLNGPADLVSLPGMPVAMGLSILSMIVFAKLAESGRISVFKAARNLILPALITVAIVGFGLYQQGDL